MMHEKISKKLASQGSEQSRGGGVALLMSGIFRIVGFPGGNGQFISLP